MASLCVIKIICWVWWLMVVISALQEAEVEGPIIQSHIAGLYSTTASSPNPQKILCWTRPWSGSWASSQAYLCTSVESSVLAWVLWQELFGKHPPFPYLASPQPPPSPK